MIGYRVKRIFLGVPYMETTLARVATMNGNLLQELSVEQVLELHPLIDPTKLVFRRAKKTKPIKAKAINTILSDPTVQAKVLLATLEGNQTLKANSFVCVGVDGDYWQQAVDKILAKYTIESVDPNGWLTCVPKPENETNACQILAADHKLGPHGGFSVIGQWGEERMLDGKKVYLQYGVDGDCVMQNINDLADVYRIDQKMFRSTYEYV